MTKRSLAGSLTSAGLTFGLLLATLPAACSREEPRESSYFDRSISPILSTSCSRANTGAGCHVSTPKGNAFGNLDTTSFEGIARRRDLLTDYGPYGQPAFLIKNVPDFQVEVQSFDGTKVVVTTDIKHAGGPIFEPTATAYQTLRRWINAGATKNNTGLGLATAARTPCSTGFPGAPGFDPAVDPSRADFAAFRDKANPTLRTCAAGNCHGTPANDLYLTCGDSPEQIRWNYFAATQYLAQTPEQSELMRRPLAPSQGGAYHEGGVLFESAQAPEYVALLDWAREHGPPEFGEVEPNLRFFAHRVQPLLVKKGCMMLQCHSAAQFHDYRLRGGSGGNFSFSATQRNYELSLAQLAVEAQDVNASRLVRKNLYRPEVFAGATGIAHRGGPLLEDFGDASASAEACDALALDYDAGPLDELPTYCVLREWHRREREARAPAPFSGIVYVKRSLPGPDRPQDFDVYAPGADLRRVRGTLDDTGAIALADDTSLTAGCGLDVSTADIRRPAVSWDGTRIAFAARASEGTPLRIYEANADGSACAPHAEINAGPAEGNGLLIHNFDPAYSPPDLGGGTHLVFSSTRGNLDAAAYGYSGPQRTPANPAKPNANLFDFGPDRQIRQLTYHLNLERHASFMQDGRVVFTAEKRAVGFYQLALRRINLDGGDYHPLFAQRGSVGYREATQVVELADRNFVAIFSDPAAKHGGGALGLINRTLGVDFQSTNPEDYLVDKSVLDPAAPQSPEPSFFLRSLSFLDGAVNGRGNAPTSGVFTSPAALPNGRILVSFGEAADAATFGGDYDVFVLDATTGARTKLFGDAGAAELEAVPIYGRTARGIFASAFDEPNAFTRILPGHSEADVHVLDMPLLATRLFQNTPTGRPIEADLRSIELLEEMPPPPEVTSFAAGGANVASDEFGQVFVKRRRLGAVPLASDGSVHFRIPGGVPFMYRLPETEASRQGELPRLQRETMVFAPGEYAHQAFKREFFDALCGNCHGAVSGRAVDVAVRPDVLTQASDTRSRGSQPLDLNVPPDQRTPIEGP